MTLNLLLLLDLHERPVTHRLAVNMEQALDVIRLVVSDPLTRFTPFVSLADCRVADGTGGFWTGSSVAGNCLRTTSPLGLGSLADAIHWAGSHLTPRTPPPQTRLHLHTSQHAFCVSESTDKCVRDVWKNVGMVCCAPSPHLITHPPHLCMPWKSMYSVSIARKAIVDQ
jgi:hypothetical protein